jgi:catechol 2,3-dioxygenase-like lactoylglutathione lyase family enzyme
MSLGHFSVSLAVRDIRAALDFYLGLGFGIYDDHLAEKWVILRLDDTLIGLFEGMFTDNILTFYTTDVASLRRTLAANGIALPPATGEDGEPATYLLLTDPDGNQIMIDQIDPDYEPTPHT